MAVILLVVVGTIGLLAREGGKVLDSRDNPPPTPTTSRASPRGEGFSNPVYWLLMSLFLLARVAMASSFFWLVVRDQWIHARPLVAGRFDQGESLRIIFALVVSVAVPSGLLWRHYRRIDSYGSPLEPFFLVVFALTAALAAVSVIPAIFAGFGG